MTPSSVTTPEQREINASNLIRPHDDNNDDDNDMKRNEITKFLAIIALQAEQLSRHEKLLNDILREDHQNNNNNRNARNRVNMSREEYCWYFYPSLSYLP